MKLKEYTHKEAKSFAIFWTIAFSLFALIVFWSLALGYRFEVQKGVPRDLFWPHATMMLIVLVSLVVSIIGMWARLVRREYEKVRQARNLSFYVVIFVFPLGLLINLVMASL